MRAPATTPVTRWGGVQRRIRRLVPAPLRRADLALFRAIARAEIPVIGAWLPRLSRAANHSRLWMALAALLAIFGGRFGRRASTRGLVATGITSAVTNLPVKLVTARVRPDLTVVPQIRRLARVPTSTSFPSGHSASAFAFATAVSMEKPRLRLPLYTLAAAVATSRVYTGVHYPADVVVGSAIGTTVAKLTARTWPLTPADPATAEPVDHPATLVDPDGTGLTVVVNPAAGNGVFSNVPNDLRNELPGAQILEVSDPTHLPAMLEEAAEEARVLGVAGGDGTASAGAAAALAAGVPLLVFPAGTLNHLARDLGIETVEHAIRALRGGQVIAMDLGEIDGETFVNAASVGLYPYLVDARNELEDHIGKWPAAVWGLLRLWRKSEPVEIEIDGQRRQVWLLFVGNGRYVAEGLAPTRRRRLDTGELDIRLVHAGRSWARTRVVLSILLGRRGQGAAYAHWDASSVRIRVPDGTLRVAFDGEIREFGGEASVRKVHRALLVVQPPPHEGGRPE